MASFARAIELFGDADTGCILTVLDPDGIVTVWGRAAERLTGHHASEVVGRHFSVIWSDAEATNALLQRTLTQGEIVEDAYLSAKGGAPLLATRRVTALPNDQGEQVGFVVTIVTAPDAVDGFVIPDQVAAALLDAVVHPIFAAGLELNAVLSTTTDPQIRQRVTASIDRLDEALRNLRGAVGDAMPPSDPSGTSPRT